jgi:hypothetical protein
VVNILMMKNHRDEGVMVVIRGSKDKGGEEMNDFYVLGEICM